MGFWVGFYKKKIGQIYLKQIYLLNVFLSFRRRRNLILYILLRFLLRRNDKRVDFRVFVK